MHIAELMLKHVHRQAFCWLIISDTCMQGTTKAADQREQTQLLCDVLHVTITTAAGCMRIAEQRSPAAHRDLVMVSPAAPEAPWP